MDEANIRVIRTCRICKEEKDQDYLVRNKVFKSSFDTICLSCSREKVRIWRQNNKDHHNKLNRQYQKRRNKVVLAKTRKYQLAKRQRVPIWADINKIKDFYLNCPEGYHVDHIVPLQGELVSGLHVETNLQYLPAKVNHSKGNKWTT